MSGAAAAAAAAAAKKLGEMRNLLNEGYNRHFFISAQFVADKCAAVVKVWGVGMEPDLRLKFQNLEKALRQAYRATLLQDGDSYGVAEQNEAVRHQKVRLVAQTHFEMGEAMMNAMRVLISDPSLDGDTIYAKLKRIKNNPLTKALAEFVEAMKLYHERNPADFRAGFANACGFDHIVDKKKSASFWDTWGPPNAYKHHLAI
jgi:hypothetical protein